jgi:dTDP-4-dehydrorhamnose reductase
MIGHRMWATLSKKHETYGTLRRESLGRLELIPGLSKEKCFFGVDAYAINSISQVIQTVKPNVVLNCIGIVKQLKDSNDHLKSIALNALFPHQLAKICAENDVRMIQFSSDCVFDGVQGQYTESDFPNAQDLYGRSKALGEIDYLKNVVTMRTSSIGREVFPHGGLLEWFLGNQGKKITGYQKAIYSGFPTHRLAEIISEYLLPRPEISGVLHISSQPIDKLSLLQMIKKHFNLNIEIAEDQKVSIERSLDCSKFSDLTGFVAPAWQDMMVDLELDFETYSQIRNLKG